MKRKDFLKYSASSFLMPSALKGFGMRSAPSSWMNMLNNSNVETDKVLVLVRMDGGNDGLNTVVPITQYDRLTAARETVILPESSLLGLDGVDEVKLHPAMTEMRNLYNEGKLQIIQSVGYPNPDYSHFRSTDIWMTGSDSDQVLNTGWAGRYLHNEFPNFPINFPNEDMPDPLALEIGSFLSLTFTGPNSGMSISVSDPTSFYELIDGSTGSVPNTPAGAKLDYIRLIQDQSNAYGTVIKEAAENVVTQQPYPEYNDLAQQLKIVAQLIAGGLKTRIFMVSIGGFDTHDNQVDPTDHTDGAHAELLKEVSQAIDAFMKDIEFLGLQDRVVGMTFSEFGRRIISNFSDGTDHGAAAPLFVFGHNIQGGILGDTPFIPANADENSNLVMQYDFRSIYSTMIQDWFCVTPNEASDIMLQDFQKLPIISQSDCLSTSTKERLRKAGKSILSVYPNPFIQSTNFTFHSNGGHCILQVFNSEGRKLKTIASKVFPQGEHSISWNAEDLPTGTYHVRLQNGAMQQVKSMMKVM